MTDNIYILLALGAALGVIFILPIVIRELKKDLAQKRNRIAELVDKNEKLKQSNELLKNNYDSLERLKVQLEETLAIVRKKNVSLDASLESCEDQIDEHVAACAYFESLLPVTMINGIGDTTKKKLEECDIFSIGDIAHLSAEQWAKKVEGILPQKVDYLDIKKQAEEIIDKAYNE